VATPLAFASSAHADTVSSTSDCVPVKGAQAWTEFQYTYAPVKHGTVTDVTCAVTLPHVEAVKVDGQLRATVPIPPGPDLPVGMQGYDQDTAITEPELV
jgi:hypothetical protein